MPLPTPTVSGRTRGRSSTAATLLVALLVAVAALAGCGGGSDDDEGGTSATSSTAGSSTGGSGGSPAPNGRVVALGEERVLADLLALGVKPVASTANVIVDDGFVGLDGLDADGVEPLPSTDPNIERLAALEPDVIVANEFVVETLGRDVLDQLAEVIVVPEGDAATQIRALGDAFDRQDEAEALIDELESAIADGREALAALPESARTVSVVTVYPGPTLAAWVDGPVDVPATLLDLGFTLRPDPAAVAGADGGATEGRAYLSEEQLGLLDAPTLIALQSEYVEGEDAALAALAETPLWKGLPAVESGDVLTVDRLGYPGIAGRIRLVQVLVDELGA